MVPACKYQEYSKPPGSSHWKTSVESVWCCSIKQIIKQLKNNIIQGAGEHTLVGLTLISSPTEKNYLQSQDPGRFCDMQAPMSYISSLRGSLKCLLSLFYLSDFLIFI